jgi:Zn-finger nucleic acid-binding protein
MPTCPHCAAEHDAADLVRHDRSGVTVVHCPDCEFVVGAYRRHGDRPKVDRLRDA